MTVCIDDMAPSGRSDLICKPDGRKWNRNTLYEEGFCDLVVAMGKEGATYAQMCKAMEVCKRTVDNWRESMPDFDNAVRAALTASEAFRDSQGQRNIEWADDKGNPQFRHQVWSAFKEEFKPVPEKASNDETMDEAVDDLLKSVVKRIQTKGETK